MATKSFSIKKLQHKTSEDGKTASFSGYLAVFGNKDSYGDVIMPGAFSRSINALKSAGKKLKMLWQHDTTFPIGIFNSLTEDDHGLKVEGEINLEVEKGAECYALMKQGAIDSMSIGYQTLNENIAMDDDGEQFCQLIEIKLWEGSLVTFPANELALVGAVKSGQIGAIDLVIKFMNELKVSLASSHDTPGEKSTVTEVTEGVSIDEFKNLMKEF
jgi:HK97 family phage prohead protease